MYTFTFIEYFSKQDNFSFIKKSGGIYKITCKTNGSFYIGQTSCFSRRFREHSNELRQDKHYNLRLQNCFNKYGCESFYAEPVEIIEKISKNVLTEREQYWVDILNPDLNLTRIVDSPLGYRHTKDGVKNNITAQRNRTTLNPNNISGYKGVCFCKSNGSWYARIFVASRSISLGAYESPEKARQVRLEAESKYWTDEFDNLSLEDKLARLQEDKDLRIKNRSRPDFHKFIHKESDGVFKVRISRKYIGGSKDLQKAILIRDNYLKLSTSTAKTA